MATYTILQRYLYRGNKTWYGRINDGGKISYRSLKTKRKADAQAWLDAQNAARFFPELAGKAERVTHDLNRVILEFLEMKEATLGSAGSLTRYNNDLKHVQRFAIENGLNTIEDWTSKAAQDFTAELAANDGPVATGRVVQLAASVWKFAARRYDLDRKNPFDGIQKPKIPKRVKEFWTPQEIDAILDAQPNKAIRLNWALMAFAGLRYSEACNLTPEDYSEGRLHIIGKGDKEAFVPVSTRLAHEIERAGGIQKIKHVKRTEARELQDCAREVRASGKKANPHKFRHSFVSNLYRAGVGVKDIQALARHENITTTLQVYAHVKTEDLEKAVDKIK